MGDVLPSKRRKKMPFGKKLTEKISDRKIVELNFSQIEAAVLTYLSALKAIKYNTEDVFSLDLSDIVGKKPTEIVRVGIQVRKEV